LTEETVSRIMADFARKKIIESGKGFIRILDRKWLGETAGVSNDSTGARDVVPLTGSRTV
jgi:hypothetical protein